MNGTPLILLLGSNLGQSPEILEQARAQLGQRLGKIERASSLYRTRAWGETNQPDFLNQVVSISFSGRASTALQAALQIELSMGRTRIKKWGARTLDIDLLYHGNAILKTPELTLPHPALHLRRFTLIPLVEIAPDFVHPVLLKTQQQLLDECPDSLEVTRLSEA
ncbi:MAG: 2-amino-4-hydroxy-6-hydroxymethyldihydropteridine diphosphokinase [Cyclobacteriaceae bacterium]|nr:2-amino-4-hydroxy-6-hydroxymethyldihydropteridine diphosphokinase [Cyclobacteriaceae bacterium]